jgi:hypothetical protein
MTMTLKEFRECTKDLDETLELHVECIDYYGLVPVKNLKVENINGDRFIEIELDS